MCGESIEHLFKSCPIMCWLYNLEPCESLVLSRLKWIIDGCEIGDRVQGTEEVRGGSLFFPPRVKCVNTRSHGSRALLCPGVQHMADGAGGLYRLNCSSPRDSLVLILFLPWLYLDTGRKRPLRYQGCGCGVHSPCSLPLKAN